MNPRPAASAFAKYYTDSATVKYWATTFHREIASARRKKILESEVNLIVGILIKDVLEINLVFM